MSSYSKKYAKKLLILDRNAQLTRNEKVRLVEDLNLLIEKLIEEQNEELREILPSEDSYVPKYNPFRFKYFAPALTVALGCLFISSNFNDGSNLVNYLSAISSILLAPFTMATGCVDLAQWMIEHSAKKNVQKLEKQKKDIYTIQKYCKNLDTGNESLRLIDEDEFLKL